MEQKNSMIISLRNLTLEQVSECARLCHLLDASGYDVQTIVVGPESTVVRFENTFAEFYNSLDEVLRS